MGNRDFQQCKLQEIKPMVLSISRDISQRRGEPNYSPLCHALLDDNAQLYRLQIPPIYPLLKLLPAINPSSSDLVYPKSLWECHSPTCLVWTRAGQCQCCRCRHYLLLHYMAHPNFLLLNYSICRCQAVSTMLMVQSWAYHHSMGRLSTCHSILQYSHN